MELKPLIKWAGGKRQLIPKIKELMPKKFNDYYEPFVGAGALFLNLQPSVAYINDINSELFKMYSLFNESFKVTALTASLDILYASQLDNPNLTYSKLVDSYKNDNGPDDVVCVARLIYLNRTCFNGLYRVNKKGYFNVPRDKKRNSVKLYDIDNINNIKTYFETSNINVTNTDFTKACENAKAGDFVYFDPPYDKEDDKVMHTSYSKDGFNKNDQFRLFELFKLLTDRGVYCMLSNNATPFILDLYKDYNINIVSARRSINSNKNGRNSVNEVIITNY